MKIVCELNQSNLDLAKQEVLSLTSKAHKMYWHLLIKEGEPKILKRLAYTKSVYGLLWIAKKSDLAKKIHSFNWDRIIKGSFAVRSHHHTKKRIKFTERQLGELVYDHQKNPKVNLSKPDHEIHFFILKNEVVCAEKIADNTEKFEKRQPHKREAHIPISLDPKLARALINLANPSLVLDPFCGTGGILLEAKLLKIPFIGIELDQTIARMAKTNLKSKRVLEADMNNVLGTFPWVVTDPPYGKNTKQSKKEALKLYDQLFLKFKEWKTKVAVIGAPHFLPIQNLIKKHNLKIQHKFTIRLHKSLTKHIFVIKR